ncbi:hypothetical protein BCV63_11130 [Cylindrospermopsis raciborskii CS-508]|uniref:class I SAM-dependent methyltransferase n=1 Tax=Cylindrospermopsis raciborskii TaxID=77022 RepID=UPI0008DCFCCA|nr:class I SAM-dependent methyltransferase [Cylindrospermopsis raciborskii]OHY41070.1 hypothetical protein BCV63_11130 [Cylindrospermopsis raciborskii CS-508]
MTDPDKIQSDYYTQTASSYDDMHGDPEHDVALSYISSLITGLNISNILDVGCGTGRGIKYFLSKHKNLTIKGVEPVEALIEIAVNKNHISHQLISKGNGENLPFTDQSFDAVFELAMLHHVPHPNLVVSEMIRVARKAIFISDSNRFGQGSYLARWVKLILYKLGLWKWADLIRTQGKGYTITPGDGLAYSYSVFDSYDLLAQWADRIILIPTVPFSSKTWFHPLLTSGHILMCAIRE